jgi:hypothetical protein
MEYLLEILDPVFCINFDGADVLVERLQFKELLLYKNGNKLILGNESLYKFHNCILYAI